MHILIIEDDPAIATTLRFALEREGYTVSWADTVAKVAPCLDTDKIGDEAVYLGFDEYKQSHAGLPSDDDLTKGNAVVFEIAEAIGSVADDTTPTKKYHLKKTDFIFRTDTAQRQVLDQMFAGQTKPHHSSHDGRYEMFYPYQVHGKTVAVLYLTDYLTYGKISSGSY